MAYKNLVNVACSSGLGVFRHLRDWLVARSGIADYSSSGLGLTVLDSYYASSDQDSVAIGDWVVLQSTGEDGRRSIVFRLLCSSVANGIVRVSSGLNWNATTNAWVVGMYSGQDVPNGPTSGTAFNLYIYGSLDSISIIIGNGTTLHGRALLLPKNTMHDDTVALTTASVTSGTNIIVPVDVVPASWAVGNRIFIAGTSGQERTTITAISGNNVTMTLVNSYGTGTRVAREMTMFESYNNYFLSMLYILLSHDGYSAPNNYVSAVVLTALMTASAPDPANNVHVPSNISLAGTLSNPKGYYGVVRDVLIVSSTGITSGTVYTDEATGDEYRALSISEAGTMTMYLFREI